MLMEGPRGGGKTEFGRALRRALEATEGALVIGAEDRIEPGSESESSLLASLDGPEPGVDG